MRLNEQLALAEEFERCAESRRKKAMEALEDHRWSEEQRRAHVKQEQKERQEIEEMVLATSEQLTHFQERLDRYDTGVVHALMDNRQALDRAEDALAEMRQRAFVLPDGRHAYKSEDGQRVFDDAGKGLGRDVIDPAAIPLGTPTWEQRQAAGETVHKLTSEWEDLLTYQARVDQARERAGRNDATQAELKSLADDLDHAMPETVRRNLQGLDRGGTLDKSAGPQAGARDEPRTTPSATLGMQPAPGQN